MESFPNRTRRALLLTTVASLGISALIGVGVMLFGDFGETEFRILGTSLSIAWFSLLALCFATANHRPRLRPLTGLGLVASLLGFVGLQILIWSEGEGELVVKGVAIANLIGGASAYITLVALAKSRDGFAWIRWVSMLAAATIAGLLSFLIVTEADHEWFFRAIGALSVVVACGTVAVLVLHRMARLPRPSLDGVSVDVTCPVCEHPHALVIGQSTMCPMCSLVLEVRVGSEPLRALGASG